jgi:hypothetical protein
MHQLEVYMPSLKFKKLMVNHTMCTEVVAYQLSMPVSMPIDIVSKKLVIQPGRKVKNF